jgi:hypothetical protein
MMVISMKMTGCLFRKTNVNSALCTGMYCMWCVGDCVGDEIECMTRGQTRCESGHVLKHLFTLNFKILCTSFIIKSYIRVSFS